MMETADRRASDDQLRVSSAKASTPGNNQYAATAGGFERMISSTVVEEELLQKVDQEQIRYIEVPEYIEVPKYVTKKQIVEVEKMVPKVEVEYVERVVEVPEVKYVDRVVEVERIEHVVRHVPRKERVEVKKEVIKTVPKIQIQTVEKIVEVPETIEVAKPYIVENKVEVPYFVDQQSPVVIAQSVYPFIQEAPEEVVDVEVLEHIPEVIEVEVQVPKPVAAQVTSSGITNQFHRVVKDVPPAQFNTLLKLLNPHLTAQQTQTVLPFMRDALGNTPLLAENEQIPYLHLPADTAVLHRKGSVSSSGRSDSSDSTNRQKVIPRRASSAIKSMPTTAPMLAPHTSSQIVSHPIATGHHQMQSPKKTKSKSQKKPRTAHHRAVPSYSASQPQPMHNPPMHYHQPTLLYPHSQSIAPNSQYISQSVPMYSAPAGSMPMHYIPEQYNPNENVSTSTSSHSGDVRQRAMSTNTSISGKKKRPSARKSRSTRPRKSTARHSKASDAYSFSQAGKRPIEMPPKKSQTCGC